MELTLVIPLFCQHASDIEAPERSLHCFRVWMLKLGLLHHQEALGNSIWHEVVQHVLGTLRKPGRSFEVPRRPDRIDQVPRTVCLDVKWKLPRTGPAHIRDLLILVGQLWHQLETCPQFRWR